MSGIELNKIVAAILLAALIAMLSGKIANLLYRPVLDPEQRGYKIESSDESTMDEEDKPVDHLANLNIEELMTHANSNKGKVVFKKCLTCHTINKDAHNKIGPNLWNIVNNKKANKIYSYSKPLLSKGGNWDYLSLFHFIYKPQKYIPGTKMSFIGIRNFEDIVNLIKYLESNSD